MGVLEHPTLTISSNGTLPSVPFLAIKDVVLGKRYNLSIAFVSPAIATKLNIERRAKDYTPNTLSFSLTKTSGEIVMCLSAIRAQYKKFDMTYDHYLTYLLIHSMLHLKGFAHGSTMERKETQFLKRFSLSSPHEAQHKTKHNSRN